MERHEPYRIVRGFFRFAAMFLIAVAMGLALLLIAQRIFTPFHVVASGSMSPQYEVGDAVVLKDIKTDEIKVGDVIVFLDPEETGSYVIHRVIGVEEGGPARFFLTKGDKNPVVDDWRIAAGEVAGGVAMRLPRFGSFLDFLSSPKGYLSLIAVPGLVSLMLVFLLSIFDRVDRARTARAMAVPGTSNPHM
ncbi:MAG: signal peptidase I [Actinomycetota bacterium]